MAKKNEKKLRQLFKWLPKKKKIHTPKYPLTEPFM